jgi:signal transduction histidine kinase
MIFVNMALLSLVLLVSFGVIYAIIYANVQSDNREKLNSVPAIIVGAAGSDIPNADDPETVAPPLPVRYSASFVLMADADGKLVDVFSYLDLPETTYQEALEKSWTGEETTGKVTLADRKWQYAASQVALMRVNNGRLMHQEQWQILFLDITDSESQLTRILLTLLLVGIGMLAALFLVSLLFAKRAIRPIEESWQKQRQFVADASHELKTPIAIIGANMDAIETDGEDTINNQKEWISYIRSELGRMGKLVNDMLYLAKSDEEKPEDAQIYDFSTICETAVAVMEAPIYDKKIHLTTDIEKDIPVRGDMEKIKQAVLILLENAAKYTNEGGSVSVSLKKSKSLALFCVENTGEGIPQTDIPKIFDRFYRPDSSRSTESGGYGLGLAIAKTIVERMDGEISAQSIQGLTTFTIALKHI